MRKGFTEECPLFSRWKSFLKKHLAPAEESGLYRVAVTVLVLYALTLTLHQIEWPNYWFAVLLITPLASYLSYRRRYSANLEIKIFLSFAMVALLLWFFTRLAASTYDPRIPLAELLIWLQALHAFDLPAKKDLRYTILVALILMALASVLTFSTYFSVFIFIFCALFLVVGALDFWSENRLPGTWEQGSSGPKAESGVSYRLDRRWLTRVLAWALPVSLAAAFLIFAFMPRYQGLTVRTMPMSWDLQFSLSRVSEGEIVNGASSQGGDQSGKPRRMNGDAYFGFDSEVNLNTRGTLSDKLVLKVRTSDWQYHRAVAFSDYTGGGWRSGLSEPEPVKVRRPPFYFPAANASKDRLTIYYSEIDLPNVVFTPLYPRQLFFPSEDLFRVPSFRRAGRDMVNSPAVLVAPFALETGLVYSVLNRPPDLPPSEYKNLEAWPLDDPRWRPMLPYLRLPPSVPERLREKAAEIAAGSDKPWVQANALCAYLQQNYEYKLDVPFYPEGVDTADHFLFEARQGYCEQFATALCVMARSVNLPARYVTGYLPGEYNPFSGFYEIRAKDAHAWVEIYIPGAGWVIFDPVPGGNPTPVLGETEPDGWLLESLLGYLGLSPELKRWVPVVLRASLVMAILALLVGLFRGRRKARGGLRAGSQLAPYLLRAEALTQRRLTGETVRTWAERVREGSPSAETTHPLEQLADVYERTLYQDRAPDVQDYEELESLLTRLQAMSKSVNDSPDKAL